MLCHFCGNDKERTVNVYFEDNKIPEKWCLDCLLSHKSETEFYGAEKINTNNSVSGDGLEDPLLPDLFEDESFDEE